MLEWPALSLVFHLAGTWLSIKIKPVRARFPMGFAKAAWFLHAWRIWESRESWTSTDGPCTCSSWTCYKPSESARWVLSSDRMVSRVPQRARVEFLSAFRGAGDNCCLSPDQAFTYMLAIFDPEYGPSSIAPWFMFYHRRKYLIVRTRKEAHI